MKKLLLLLLLIPQPSLAWRVATVNLQRVITEINEAEVNRKILEREFEKKQKKIVRSEKSLERMLVNFEEHRMLLAASVRIRREKKLKMASINLQSKIMLFQREIQEKEQEMKQRLYEKIKDVCDLVFKRKEVDVGILETGLLEGIHVYAIDKRDLTDLVIRVYNKKYPAD